MTQKGFAKGQDYDVKEIDIGAADNFDPDYLKINPNGTIPALTSPALSSALYESADILRYLDGLRTNNPLVPKYSLARAKSDQITSLVHSKAVDTNVLFFNARTVEELDGKKTGWQKDFFDTRQSRLEKEHSLHPADPFYAAKLDENTILYSIYQREIGCDEPDFFSQSKRLYDQFAAGMAQLEELLQLPFATGEQMGEADFHVIPWLSHAMVAAGSDAARIQDFSALESTIQKSMEDFHVGPRTREWWANVGETDTFKQVFAVLR